MMAVLHSNRRSTLLASVVLLAALPASAARGDGPRSTFIVIFKDSAKPALPVAAEHTHRFAAQVQQVYEHALKGYAASIPESIVAALLADDRVASVERDSEVRTLTTQSNATWGIDRIDQRALPLSSTFIYSSTGAGVKAYVIDTGIEPTHDELRGRALLGTDAVDGSLPAEDCNGHGTHVAGTLGGTTYGVAKSVTFVPVRVLDCAGNGTVSSVIAGIDWVTGDHQPGHPAVANMSLGGQGSNALDRAVRNSIADGISYAIAAGNSNANACNFSPARVAPAMTIGATDQTDRRASFSNRGDCVDWFAPGVGITSAWFTHDSAVNTLSGTSMATPHTAGVAALYLQNNPSASPAAVRRALFSLTTKNKVTHARSTNNHLLFTNF